MDTTIIGTIKNSAGFPLTGKLQVTLDFPIVDLSTVPHSTLTTEPAIFQVVNGEIDILLKETETSHSTYHFVFSVVEDTINYYLEDGERYSGEVHLHNGEYYTGLTQTQSSQPLIRRTIQSDRPIIDFHAAVPAIAQVFFSDLIPTGITSNVLDTSIVRLARILSTDVELSARLSARLTNAAGIPSTPVGIIRATNVQSAIEELEEEKLNAAYNLSDVMDAAVAQANLGLGSAARENRDAFASASHQHPAHQDIDWMTEPPGASVLNLTNAPNSVGGYPRKWVIISIEAENYVIPAWKII